MNQANFDDLKRSQTRDAGHGVEKAPKVRDTFVRFIVDAAPVDLAYAER